MHEGVGLNPMNVPGSATE